METTELQLTKKVDFSILRYASCWEDADILLAGLRPKKGSRILSICSGGDNSLALLTTDPDVVTAFDISRVQLYMLELKKACFEGLTYQKMLLFLGVKRDTGRWAAYQKLRHNLTPDAQAYWDSHRKEIEKGVLYAGKFERYLGYFGSYVLPLIHSNRKVQRLFVLKTGSEQEDFYLKHWNSWRWRFLFKGFFSRYALGRYGRDPQFFKEVKKNVGGFIYDKAASHLTSAACQENYFLHFMLRGSFITQLPFYLRKENFEAIRENLPKLQLLHGSIEDILEAQPYDCLNLSNIFEYMDAATFRSVAGKIAETLKPEARIAYWNLMVPRRLSNELPGKISFDEDLSVSLSSQDKCFFYDRFIVDVAR